MKRYLAWFLALCLICSAFAISEIEGESTEPQIIETVNAELPVEEPAGGEAGDAAVSETPVSEEPAPEISEPIAEAVNDGEDSVSEPIAENMDSDAEAADAGEASEPETVEPKALPLGASLTEGGECAHPEESRKTVLRRNGTQLTDKGAYHVYTSDALEVVVCEACGKTLSSTPSEPRNRGPVHE